MKPRSHQMPGKKERGIKAITSINILSFLELSACQPHGSLLEIKIFHEVQNPLGTSVCRYSILCFFYFLKIKVQVKIKVISILLKIGRGNFSKNYTQF